MARGISQDQVSAAADGILAEGENPTVEKVRAVLGTGSPNTVTRMLDSWRVQLGERLRELNALPDLPATVGQAMTELWRLATEHAKGELAGHFAKDRAQLEAAHTKLAEERISWEERLKASEIEVTQAQARRELAEQTCATLDSQLHDAQALRADLVQQRDRLQTQSDFQAGEIDRLRREREERDLALNDERSARELHLRTVEDRAHHEVDRARQETKSLQQQIKSMQSEHDAKHAELTRLLGVVQDKLRTAEQDIARQTGQLIAMEKALVQARTAATVKKRKPKPAVAGTKSQGVKQISSRAPRTKR